MLKGRLWDKNKPLVSCQLLELFGSLLLGLQDFIPVQELHEQRLMMAVELLHDTPLASSLKFIELEGHVSDQHKNLFLIEAVARNIGLLSIFEGLLLEGDVQSQFFLLAVIQRIFVSSIDDDGMLGQEARAKVDEKIKIMV